MSKPYHIHFVCIGNAYRSRLAEAYLRSLGREGLVTSSSGLEADFHRPGVGPIAWFALRLTRKHGIIRHISMMSVQTTREHVVAADRIVLMHGEVLKAYREKFGEPPVTLETWDIPDVGQFLTPTMEYDERERITLRVTEDTYVRIRNRVDELMRRLSEHPEIIPSSERS